jgi:SynChlorMet cassette radical SAM/SPASM protein ScmF
MSEINRQRTLTQLNIFLDHNNSLACRNCQSFRQVPGNGNGHRHTLPLEIITLATAEALPLGLQTVRLSGGEPFLYPRIDALIDHLESQELSVVIETSGSGLTARRAARLAHLPQARVIIGLDGAGPVTHDTLHNYPGAFEIATHAIRMLAEVGLAPHIQFTITRQNHAQLGTTIHLVELLGAESIHFASIRPDSPSPKQAITTGNQPTCVYGTAITVEEMIALARKVERDLTKTTRLRLSVDLPPAFRGLHPQARVEGQGRCSILNSLALLNTGEYALCGGASAVPGLVFGSDPLEEIWNHHPTLATLRETLPGHLEGICGRCIMKAACLGFCAAENYLCTGTFEGPNLFCQSAEQVGLFPAGRLIENLFW